MIVRSLTPYLKEQLDAFPAVALLGPRQVGKTTLALELAKTYSPSPLYLDLERPSDLAKLSDAEYYLSQHQDQLLIIDEIQRKPEIFPLLRSLIDQRRREGQKTNQYLLLGSASNELLHQSSESLAGRICYIDMTGVNLLEVGAERQDDLWLRGGFPDSLQANTLEVSFRWREALIRTYLEREIPILGSKVSSENLRRFWAMLAHTQSEILNASRLGSSLGISVPTIGRYLDLFVNLFLVRVLRPWSSNLGKRLVKSPKVYVRDSGLVHAMLGLKSFEDLISHPIVGSSWEAFVIENIASVLKGASTLWFYHTIAGAEVDLLIENSPGSLIAIEIKRSLSPAISRGLSQAIEDLKPQQTFIIYPGKDRYRLSSKVEVISLNSFLQMLSS